MLYKETISVDCKGCGEHTNKLCTLLLLGNLSMLIFITDLLMDKVWYYIYIYIRNWVDTRWQQYSTYLHTKNTFNNENEKYITEKIKYT
jgi:hypothetical protein